MVFPTSLDPFFTRDRGIRHDEHCWCRNGNEVRAEYALGGISNQMFASRYVPYIPDKELLIRQVELLLQEAAEQDVP